MTDENETTEVVAQPALPTLELPDFEGLRPVGVVTRVNGAGNRIARALHLEDRVVLVLEAEVSNVGHAATDDGVKRVHTLRVKDLYELEGKAGVSLLRSLRQAYRLADDQRHARARLGMAELEQPESNAAGIDVVVDDEGRVHTATAGEDGGLGLPLVDVAVIVFHDGTRSLWPDDFPGAAGPHPEAGEYLAKPGSKHDDPELVSKVLDADTGETLEEWTEEQEEDRLRAEEAAAAIAEAKADRDATDELLAARERHTIVERLFATEDGTTRAAGSVIGNVGTLDDVATVELALKHETSHAGRKTVVAALEARLTAIEAAQ